MSSAKAAAAVAPFDRRRCFVVLSLQTAASVASLSKKPRADVGGHAKLFGADDPVSGSGSDHVTDCDAHVTGSCGVHVVVAAMHCDSSSD